MSPRIPGRSIRISMLWSCGLLLTLALGGCAVGPNYETPSIAVPARWSTAANSAEPQATDLTAWWRRFADPTLDDLVEAAIVGNLDVASAKARIREARAAFREQTGTLYPEVDASGSADRSRTVSSGVAAIRNSFQAGFDASWEVDLFGANRRAAEAARANTEAAEEDLRDVYVTLIGDVASSYIEARKYQALTALASRTARSQRETARLTRQKLDAGGATGVESSTAEAQAASTEASIPAYRISYRQSLHRLGVLLGKPPSSLEAVLDKPSRIPRPAYPVRSGIPADILTSRPDIRAAERRLAQYTAKIGQAEADRYPSVSLTGAIATSSSNLSDLAKSSSISWSFGPSLTVPIFNGGRLKGAVEVAKSERDQYRIAYQSAVLNAMEEVENAIVALNQSRIRRARLAEAVSAYREATRLSDQLNEAGTTALLDVLEVERSLFSSEQSLIEADADIATYYVSLHKALGGGWIGTVAVEREDGTDDDMRPKLASR